ncbi:MAG: iron-sulfur cluster repair di-iron protein [Bacteroidetes bacterium]|nr:iron-sulfur cluster repair di-iron protein [Bacteroidota bacterium]
MEISKDTIVGDLVAQDYRVASVFKQQGIDFCCNGNRSIAEVCQQDNIAVEPLINALKEAAHNKAGSNIDYNSWPLDLLADYIEKTHHRYVENKSREIMPFLEKIVRVHGERHPELAKVEHLFKESVGELARHMKKEELMLFPAIRKMVQAKLNNTKSDSPIGSVAGPINVMMQEHDTEGERFREISKLTDNYTVPSDGCNTYKITLLMLHEFEEDLHLHIHLENNILFPKSIAMEEQMA